MKRIVALVGVALLLTAVLSAEKLQVGREGKAWLERNTAPADANVTGVWTNDDWGDVTFDQAENGRAITGDADLKKVDGVVSGKKVFLVLSKMGFVHYSAVLSLEQDGTLSGTYADYLKAGEKDGQRKMVLKRTSTKVVQPVTGNESETGRIVIYSNREKARPGIFVDGRQVAWMGRRSYFTVRVAPGPHELFIRGEGFRGHGPAVDPLKVDVRAGETCYFEAGRWGAWLKWWEFRAKTAADASKELIGREPLDPTLVVADSLVSLTPIAAK
jgi:hypothetical protein